MRIGLVDVDGHNYPNLPLMKISAWHKQQGDSVEWYAPLISGHMDIVYLSKVFSFTKDFEHPIDADNVYRGGSGYCIELIDGKEIYHKERDTQLPYEIEHIYPDYSLYPDQTKDTAYGFLSRGCPRGCDFCHVKEKEGRKAYKVADLSEFWRGQKNIVLCDPNILAVKERKELLQQLIDSKAWVDFNQGLDIRLMTDDMAEMIKRVKVQNLHFAWDRYEDKDAVLPRFEAFKRITKIDHRKLIVYVLVNFDTTLDQDLERIYTLRDIGFDPFVMIYDKDHAQEDSNYMNLQRWVNNKWVFNKCERFEEYDRGTQKTNLLHGQQSFLGGNK